MQNTHTHTHTHTLHTHILVKKKAFPPFTFLSGLPPLTFTFMHLADAFIESDLQCIQAIHFFSICVPWELNPQPFALLTQCSTTEPQEH